MAATLISGKEIAQKRREVLAQKVAGLKERGIVPGLATILVGDDPASAIYVRNKIKACEKTGIRSFHVHLSAESCEEEVLAAVQKMNENKAVHGILVQLPLPKQIEEAKVLEAIHPKKDADGFHPFNLGKLLQKKFIDVEGEDFPLPCTPAGCLVMLKEAQVELSGKRAVVVGRSTIVGKPVALLLLANNATVTLCHSRTKDLASVTRGADILIAAIGKARMIIADMVKEGAVIIDVGINRDEQGLCGDVDFDAVQEKAAAISPVPGGVGPMTVQMLLENAVRNCERLSS